MENNKKICYKCKIEKLVINFNKNKSIKDGFHSYCKECYRLIKKEAYKNKDKSHEKEYQKLYRSKKSKNKIKIAAYMKEYRKNNKEKFKKYRATNKYKEYFEKYYIEHLEERQEKYQKIKFTNKHISGELFRGARRRAKKHNLPITISSSWILDLVEKFTVCPITNKPFMVGTKTINKYSRTLDRINPLLGYTKDNTILVSSIANIVKSNAAIEEIGKLVKFLEKINTMKRYSWEEKMYSLNIREQKITFTNNRKHTVSYSSTLLAEAKRRAKTKSIPFSITNRDIIIPEKCPVFGFNLHKNNNKGPAYYSPSIDRIDNSKGYTKNNIQIISNKVNIMKNACSMLEIKEIYEGYEIFTQKYILK